MLEILVFSDIECHEDTVTIKDGDVTATAHQYVNAECSLLLHMMSESLLKAMHSHCNEEQHTLIAQSLISCRCLRSALPFSLKVALLLKFACHYHRCFTQ